MATQEHVLVHAPPRRLRPDDPAAAGDQAEGVVRFEDLYDEYAGLVGRIASRLLGPLDEVDDVVQEVFMMAARGLSQVQSRDTAAGWLATITVRCAHRRLQRGKMRAFFGRQTPLDIERLVAPHCDPDDRIIVARIFAALDKLRVSERVAWTLRYLEGETVERVATLCECSLSTAKRRIAAAQAEVERVIGHG